MKTSAPVRARSVGLSTRPPTRVTTPRAGSRVRRVAVRAAEVEAATEVSRYTELGGMQVSKVRACVDSTATRHTHAPHPVVRRASSVGLPGSNDADAASQREQLVMTPMCARAGTDGIPIRVGCVTSPTDSNTPQG